MQDWPTFQEAPIAQIREVCPRTVILCSGGTRRAAMLEGIQPTSVKEYFLWGMRQLDEMVARWFDFGVKDLFVSFIYSSLAREAGIYGANLIPLGVEVLDAVAAAYTKSPPPFAVKTFGDADFPRFADRLAHIRAVTDRPDTPRLWWTFAATSGSPYTHALTAIAGRNVRTQAEAIAAIYGPEVAPCRMYIGGGKPLLTAEFQLPFLIDEAQAMWYQMPGYRGLSPTIIRRMIYEATVMRSTWSENKDRRYADVQDRREEWERPLILGVGRRLGAFWYPDLQPIEEST